MDGWQRILLKSRKAGQGRLDLAQELTSAGPGRFSRCRHFCRRARAVSLGPPPWLLASSSTAGPMLHLHFANRYEDLRDLLIAKLAGPRDDVFAADQVIVPSAAVRRALTLALADREGVCANVEFMFLARWLWRQVARVVPGVAAESPFDPAALAWRVYARFRRCRFRGRAAAAGGLPAACRRRRRDALRAGREDGGAAGAIRHLPHRLAGAVAGRAAQRVAGSA